MDTVLLGWTELLLALSLFALVTLTSWHLRLGESRVMAVAAVRMSAQLLALGMILDWVFRMRAPLAVVGLAAAMGSIAAVTAVRRTGYRYDGIFGHGLLAVLGAAGLLTGLTIVLLIPVRPWYEPRYLIPVAGMILGNMMNGVSLALDRLLAGVAERRQQIETDLALGATAEEALQPEMRQAVRAGMTPILNAMLVMGIVSLPGMMTGQLLGGAIPAQAVRYQIVIVLAVAAGIFMAILFILHLARRGLCTVHQQLRSERIRTLTL